MSNVDKDLGIDKDFKTTKEIETPDKLIDQVIGQDKAVEIAKNAAKQKRHILMIGKPGTGKSMIAKAMRDMLPREDLKDILILRNKDNENEPQIREVSAGQGEKIKEEYNKEAERKKNILRIPAILFGILIAIYTLFFSEQPLLGVIAILLLALAYRYFVGNLDSVIGVPNVILNNSNRDKPRFEDATGSHTGNLLGDVRHDPYQSGNLGTPAHQRVEAGAIHKSHKGILFIDEIKTLRQRDQQKLLTAIQEGEFAITGQSERSSGAMVSTEPVPTDFVLVAAGNKDSIEEMHPALRSRLRGYGNEIYLEDTIEDNEENREKFIQFIAQEVEKAENIPHLTKNACEEVLKVARKMAGTRGELTLELRELGGLIRSAGDIAKKKGKEYTGLEDVLEAKEMSKSIEQQMADKLIEQKKQSKMLENTGSKVGKVNGLAVIRDGGTTLPLEATISPAIKGEQGKVEATGKLQEIAQESIQNVSAIVKRVFGEEVSQKDIHVQFIQTYEGVEGDSASITVATAIMSAMSGIPVKQTVAMTGSLSVKGEVMRIGGVSEKIEAAVKSDIETVIIPDSNKHDIILEPETKEKVDIRPVKNIKEVLEIALEDTEGKKEILEKLSYVEN